MVCSSLQKGLQLEFFTSFLVCVGFKAQDHFDCFFLHPLLYILVSLFLWISWGRAKFQMRPYILFVQSQVGMPVSIVEVPSNLFLFYFCPNSSLLAVYWWLQIFGDLQSYFFFSSVMLSFMPFIMYSYFGRSFPLAFVTLVQVDLHVPFL
jgi:hypothetical protein